MDNQSKHFIIVAGEDSGDMHGAHLVTALKAQSPSITFSGLGGEQMKAAGVTIHFDLTKLAVVGFIEVIKQYGAIRNAFNLIIKKIKEEKPVAVILIDYPGFNLMLAEKIKKMGIKVIYYISPQIWAWKEKRVYKIKKCVDQMLVIFEFEKTLYDKYNVNSTFVGHPLINSVKVKHSKAKILKLLNLDDYKLTVGLLPGSRRKEIERHLPLMAEAVALLRKEYPMMQFICIKAPSIDKTLIEDYLKDTDTNIAISDSNGYDTLNACDLAIVSSGTATLETALLGKPMVIIYITSLLTYAIAKIFIKIPNIGLINVVAQKKIVPELIQGKATAQNVVTELKKIFTDEILCGEIKGELRNVKNLLGKFNASEKAANEILTNLN